jgi:hypothetical protein
MGTSLKRMIGAKKSKIAIRYCFLGSSSATLFPGLDSGLYDGHHPMRDNVTVSTCERSTAEDLNSMARFCEDEYKLPVGISEQVLNAAPYPTCWYLHQIASIYREYKTSVPPGQEADYLLERFLGRVFEVILRWSFFCCVHDPLLSHRRFLRFTFETGVASTPCRRCFLCLFRIYKGLLRLHQ